MLRRRVLFALAPALLTGRAQAATEILVRFPPGTFLENLVVGEDGRVLFTNYFARRIEAWSPATGHAAFAEVPAHPVSLAALGDGRHALVVHGAPFTSGAAAMQGAGAVLVLGPDGVAARRIALPGAVFPNGSLLIAPGRLLVADSALGRVWEVDLGSGGARVWIEHPALAPDAARPLPGVNGLKRAPDGTLLLSNSTARTLLRLRLAGGAPDGAPEPVARMTRGVDDFAVGPDGAVYAATHAEGLALLPPGAAEPRPIPAPGVEGSTAVALAPGGDRALLALGTGGLLEGRGGDAVLARVALPEG